MSHRKVEFWKYDATMCNDATTHLNGMRKKGYELTGISNYFSLAAYKKVDTMSTKRYSVVIEDANGTISNDSCVYRDSKEGITIYYDRNVPKYDEIEAFNNLKSNLLSNNNGKTPSQSGIYFMLFPILRNLYSADIFNSNWLDIWPTILLNLAFLIAILILGNRRRLKAKSLFMLNGFISFENFNYQKVKLYKQRYRMIPYILISTLVLIILFLIYLVITFTNPLIILSIIVSITGVLMILSSIYFSLLKGNKDYEKGFALTGSILIFLSVLFTNSVLGFVIVLLGILIIFL